MIRRPPCASACPFLACPTCAYQGGAWTCQACGKPAPAGDPVCGKCAGQESYNAVTSDARLVQSEGAATKAAPGSAGNAPEGLAIGTSPSYGQGGKPDGCHE